VVASEDLVKNFPTGSDRILKRMRREAVTISCAGRSDIGGVLSLLFVSIVNKLDVRSAIALDSQDKCLNSDLTE